MEAVLTVDFVYIPLDFSLCEQLLVNVPFSVRVFRLRMSENSRDEPRSLKSVEKSVCAASHPPSRQTKNKSKYGVRPSVSDKVTWLYLKTQDPGPLVTNSKGFLQSRARSEEGSPGRNHIAY